MDDLLRIESRAPDWFHRAIARPVAPRHVAVDGCPIHYLRWDVDAGADCRGGLLFIHGGGAHAHWWRFVAPYFTRDFRVAAMDLSGMGDSGRRAHYDATVRAREIAAVLDDAGLAGLASPPFVVGHSFGGYMTMRFGAAHGDDVAGAVIVDSPIRTPSEHAAYHRRPRPEPRMRRYPDFATALSRFRLRPAQPCENAFIVEFIGRHSLARIGEEWTWKFDPAALGRRRFGEPFHEHLQALRCPAALVFGEKSALVSRDTAAYMSELMGPEAPVVEIPEAQHHVMLDQPLAFVAALRAVLEGWLRAAEPRPAL